MPRHSPYALYSLIVYVDFLFYFVNYLTQRKLIRLKQQKLVLPFNNMNDTYLHFFVLIFDIVLYLNYAVVNVLAVPIVTSPCF